MRFILALPEKGCIVLGMETNTHHGDKMSKGYRWNVQTVDNRVIVMLNGSVFQKCYTTEGAAEIIKEAEEGGGWASCQIVREASTPPQTPRFIAGGRVVLNPDLQNTGRVMTASRVEMGSEFRMTRRHRSAGLVYVQRWNKSRGEFNRTERVRALSELLEIR